MLLKIYCHTKNGILHYYFQAINPGHVEAILHYEGAALGSDPESKRTICTAKHKCTVLNCPFK